MPERFAAHTTSIVCWAEMRFFYLARVERMFCKAGELVRDFIPKRVEHTKLSRRPAVIFRFMRPRLESQRGNE